MSHRQRAKDRLGRHTFGWEDWTHRGPSPRIRDRESEKEVNVRLLEVRVPQRDKVRQRSLRVASAGPNAPLLKRLVRYPYALNRVPSEKTEGRPVDVWTDPRPRPTREDTAIGQAREARVDPTGAREQDSLDHLSGEHRPDWRPHPFRKARARRGRDECV